MRLVVLLATVSSLARAQSPAPEAPPVVAADAGVITTARVALGTFARQVAFVRDGQERTVGRITETLSERTENGVRVLVRAQEITLGGRTVIDTAVSRRTTLAPIWHSSKQPNAGMVLRFAGRRVTGTHTTANAAPDSVNQVVDVAPFDSNNEEIVLGALPLADGYAARLPMYIYESKGVVWCDLRVTGRDQVDGVDAWRVAVEFAGARGTYWFAIGTGVMLRSDIVVPSGATMRVTLVR